MYDHANTGIGALAGRANTQISEMLQKQAAMQSQPAPHPTPSSALRNQGDRLRAGLEVLNERLNGIRASLFGECQEPSKDNSAAVRVPPALQISLMISEEELARAIEQAQLILERL